MGNPISRSKNPGLAKMAKTAKGKEAVKKMGFNPDRMVAKKGGKALKPVKPNQKGLKKLPKKVRNKMGYMKNGGKVK